MLNNNTRRKNKKVYRNNKGKVVACIVGKFLKKRVNREKHLMRIYDGYAFDEYIILDSIKQGVEIVEITEKDTGAIYTCKIELFVWKGIPFDFGYGSQIALPLDCWHKCDTVLQPQQLKLI